MGLFDKVFRTQRDIAKEEITEIPWHPLTRMEQLEQFREESKEQLLVIFKHSTRCGISRMVLRSFEKDLNSLSQESMKLYFLDLLSNREISNAIASKFGVEHQSPQLVVLKDGEVVHHSSHHSISAGVLGQYA